MSTAPPLFPWSEPELVGYLEERIQAESPWTPRKNGTHDVGGTLIRIFARMVAQVSARVNQVPEQHYRAFLRLLGTEALPPAPARAPLTFTAAAGSESDPTVPAGTGVAAPAEGTQAEAVFYTEHALVLTRAALVAAYTRQPETDRYTDVTAIATGQAAGAFAAMGGAVAVEHTLLVACDALFGRSDVQTLTLTLDCGEGTSVGPLADLRWYDSTGDELVPATRPLATTKGQAQWSWASPPRLTPYDAAGQTAAWLQARLPMLRDKDPPPPAIQAVGTSVTIRVDGAVPETVMANDTALDLTRDFLVLGNAPRVYDAFHIFGGQEYLRGGATVTLRFTLSDTLWGDKGSLLRGTPDLVLSWQVWSGSGWTNAAKVVDDTAKLTFQGPGGKQTQTVALTLPSQVATTTVHGQAGAWLRVRIEQGGYGLADGTLAPPGNVTAQLSAAAETSNVTWSYVVVAIGAAGTSTSVLASVNGPANLDAAKTYVLVRWQAVAKAQSYAIYRLAGPSVGFIGTTTGTGTLFADVGQLPGNPPVSTPAPARPVLRALTLDYGTLTLSSDAATPVSCVSGNDGVWQLWSDRSEPFPAFQAVADRDPALYLGFDRAFANRATALFLQLDPATPEEAASVLDAKGLAAARPSLHWEYHTAAGTFAPLHASDETAALSRSGGIRFLGPMDFAPATCFGKTHYWLRARLQGELVPPRRLRRVLTNTVWAVQAKQSTEEILGSSRGAEGQTFQLGQTPVLLGEAIEVREPQRPPAEELAALRAHLGSDPVRVAPATASALEQIWVRWLPVADFHGSGPLDRHYTLDRRSGTLRFGDGRKGRIPFAGMQNIRAASYRSGGGSQGNRAAGSITQLKSSIAAVASAINHEAAAGGADAEPPARYKRRSARALRHGDRAVTLQDFEDLALAASPAIALAGAIGCSFDPMEQAKGPDPSKVTGLGRVLVLIVPDDTGNPPVPGLALIDAVREFLQAHAAPAVEIVVAGPSWVEVQVAATLVPTSLDQGDAVRAAAQAALDAFLHPLSGNFGAGWALGRQPRASDLYRVLSTVAGVEAITALQIAFDPADPFTAKDAKDLLPARRLIYPGAHAITIAQAQEPAHA